MTSYLIIAPAWVGDMIMSQTLYKLLKQQEPDCSIDLVAPASTVSLAERMPEIRQSFLLPVGHGGLQLKARWELAKKLRQQHYDHALVLTNSWKSALVPFLAGIPKRTGWRGEFRYGLLNDVRILDKAALPLMIERFCALGLAKDQALPKELPYPSFTIDAQKLAAAMAKVNYQKGSKPLLAICPGAEYGPSKRWPAAYFGEVAQAKLAEGWEVALFGGPKDQIYADEIQNVTNNGCLSWLGKTTLPEAIDLLSLADAVVTNDSGLMHIAAALNRAIVVMYGSTSPGFTPPLSKNVQILNLHLSCSPCFERVCPLGHNNCMKQLTPQMVLAALKVLE